MLRPISTIILHCFVCLAMALPGTAGAGQLRPRILPAKPAEVVLQAHHRDDVITVKFHDDLAVRVRNGLPSDLGSGVLADAGDALGLVAGGFWQPAHTLPEARLAELRATAEANSGRALADLNSRFNILLPEGVSAAEAIDAFNALDIVEIAAPVPIGPPAPTPPDFGPKQGDHHPSPVGVDAHGPWDALGARGSGVKVCVIDYWYNSTHQDLPSVTLLGNPPPAFNDDHGTASIGVVAALDNGWGTTGLAPASTLYFAAAEEPQGNWDVSAAIVNALGGLGSGDVILIEQQWFGPCSNPVNPCYVNNGNTQYGLVPVEWRPFEYNAILTATGLGVTVIEAAGNGEQDLDNAVYTVDDPNSPEVENHDPFNNDSGAIIVGAGAAPQWPFFGSDVARSRLWFSNYGSRLNLQGWGELVPTVGYGSAYNAEGMDLNYTTTFDGTSSAAAVVAGAAAVLQSAYKQSTGGVLSPAALRSALVSTGAAQQAGTYPTSQNIGPLPDVNAAILSTTSECLPAWDVSLGNPGLLWSGGSGPANIWGMALFDDGSGAGQGLYIGGDLTSANGLPVNHIVRYDGGGWSTLGSGITGGDFGTNFTVRSMAVFDDGNGDALYVGGDFIGAGGINAKYIAKWDGQQWSALGNGSAWPVWAMAVYDDGNGDALYIGAPAVDAPQGLGKWDGTSWSAIGVGTAWPTPNCSPIFDMAVYDDGNGDALYYGGCFWALGDIPSGSARGIARWDGQQYTSVGGGLAGGFLTTVRDIIVHDDGSGPDLYVAGEFTSAGGSAISHVARWDGSQWSALGSGVNNQGWALGVYDDGDGTGQDLYVSLPGEMGADGATPMAAGGKTVRGMAKWDGTEWWPVDAGVKSGNVQVMQAYDDGSGASLYVSGVLFDAGDMATTSLALWTGCPAAPCPWDLGGDGSVGTADLLALLSAWGPNPGHPADFNGDGSVGTSDLLALLSNWGGCP
jgi:subtilisin family serine protease